MDGPLTDFPAEFTFSEAELQDVLVFMERQQAGGPADPSTASLPFLNPPNAGSVGLQFQPHTCSLESTTQPGFPMTTEPMAFLQEEGDTRSISSDPSPLREAPSLEEPTARSDDADFIPPGGRIKQEPPDSTGKWDLRHQRSQVPLHAAMHNATLHTSGSGGNLRKGAPAPPSQHRLHTCLVESSAMLSGLDPDSTMPYAAMHNATLHPSGSGGNLRKGGNLAYFACVPWPFVGSSARVIWLVIDSKILMRQCIELGITNARADVGKQFVCGCILDRDWIVDFRNFPFLDTPVPERLEEHGRKSASSHIIILSLA